MKLKNLDLKMLQVLIMVKKEDYYAYDKKNTKKDHEMLAKFTICPIIRAGKKYISVFFTAKRSGDASGSPLYLKFSLLRFA